MNSISGFCPRKNTIFLFINFTGNWESHLRGSIVHELAHALSPYCKPDTSIGSWLILEGIAENFKEFIFPGKSSSWVKVTSKEKALKIFNQILGILDENDFEKYSEVFYGTGKYPLWTGYTIGYYLIKKYIKEHPNVKWNELFGKNPKEILNKFNKKDKMRRKILTFIVSDKKILALYSEPHQEHGEGGWFVVTGGVEDSESYEGAVVREVKEETNLEVKEIFSLNWGSVYKWRDETCEEYNFISFAEPGKIILNEEHREYKWLSLNEFIEKIKWDDDKKILRNVLEKALDKEKYFKKLEIRDYRDDSPFYA